MRSCRALTPSPLMLLLLAALWLPLSAVAAPTFVNAARPELPEVARGIPMGGALVVFGLDLDGLGNTSLELERFSVFAPEARVIVDNQYSVSPPSAAYFRGRVADLPDAIVVLTVPEQGPMRGIVTDEAGVWRLAGNSGHSAPGLANRKLDLETELAGKPFDCGTESLPLDAGALLQGGDAGAPVSKTLAANVTHTATVAVETDYEYYAMFGNVDTAAAYMADLFAYASTVYEREVDTNLLIGWSRLWTSSADPWTATSGTDAALYEFRDYWNANSDPDLPAERTLVHMLSGKSLGGGIAYVGVLCNSSYAYGVSASLKGNFDIDNPGMVWDLLVVSHEIGHNFSSRHSHDYCGIGGVADSVDLCYDSAYGCGSAVGLPGYQSLTGGSAGAGNGTIMSYCHLVSGGYGNISFTFGQDHLDGVAALRVPEQMRNHVASQAAAYPNCLTLQTDGPLLSVSKSGSGDGRVTSTPLGIDCGSNCSASFAAGSLVQLAAVPNAGNVFDGWSGDCDANGQVTLNANAACGASFSSLCGNGQLDAGEQCDGVLFDSGVSCGGCAGTPTCTRQCTADLSSCFNGVCDPGEDCNSCAGDCASGSFGGAVCGNGICEAGDGEDCVSCPSDCNGTQTGKPSGRFCCGDGDGTNPLSCNDARCGGPAACSDTPSQGAVYCCGDNQCSGPEDGFSCEVDCGAPAYCGDGLCNGDENQGTCAADCGEPPTNELICDDGLDNDFDGLTDCADSDCTTDPVCQTASCEPKGAACDSAADCCSDKCNGKPGARTCG